ncbi:unnamed protein product [Moneuplotes crassus]|uniref:Uncharacterized protein n=1 Tax=Euplotes crassus TaxID=5936 RepID=A0AAD1X1I0_EUPCR|nr:unnamed protein product [Moneuplotes crassus]
MFSPQNVKIVCENWAIDVMLPTMSQIIAERFILRKQNLKRAQVVGRRICWVLKACGMFMLRHKKAKDHIARKTLLRYLIVYMKPKLKRRRKQRAQILCDFLRRTTQYPNDPNRAFLRFARLSEKIKKNLKTHLRHSRLKYCIMNYQWSDFEKQELKNHKYKDLVTGAVKRALNVPEGGVPLKIRLIYMRGYCKYQRKKYFKDLEKWEEECKVVAKAHRQDLCEKNAVRILSGNQLIKEDPVLPPKPFIHVFIPKHKLRDMVRESLYKSKSWKLIVLGTLKFADLPILKSILD